MVLKSKKHFLIFIIPALILISTFLIYPLFKTFYYSFTSWKNFSPKSTWIALDNYKRLISDPIIGKSLKNTFIMMVFVFMFQVVFSLVLAMLVSTARRTFRIFRTIYFFPIVISATAIGLMFKLIYGYEYGLLNYIVTFFGGDKKVWINEATSIYLVTIPTMWQYVGFYFVIYLTGMSKIPSEIYESAELDGINAFQKAWYITIPMIKDVICSVVILVISGCFKVFDMVYIITEGGPLNSSELLSTYMYNMAFRRYNGGYASSIAVLMIVLGVALTLFMRRILEPRAEAKKRIGIWATR